MKEHAKRVWQFLKKDSWQSWLVSLVLMFLFIKLLFFPFLSWTLGTSLPLVVVESCSMYHETGFDSWWSRNAVWYETHDIELSNFTTYPFQGGLNKGDIVIVSGRRDVREGDIIIFNADYTYPLIHRVVSLKPLSTKGDHNPTQLDAERKIRDDAVIGHAVARIPALGWLKLIFFEGLKPSEQRGFCR
jgi:signal peptidase I